MDDVVGAEVVQAAVVVQSRRAAAPHDVVLEGDSAGGLVAVQPGRVVVKSLRVVDQVVINLVNPVSISLETVCSLHGRMCSRCPLGFPRWCRCNPLQCKPPRNR